MEKLLEVHIILEQALASHGLTEKLEEMDHICQSQKDGENPEVMELNITADCQGSCQ